ncbi:MAG: hypothetical protein WBW16_11815 [Bacteroidota bacterium]
MKVFVLVTSTMRSAVVLDLGRSRPVERIIIAEVDAQRAHIGEGWD